MNPELIAKAKEKAKTGAYEEALRLFRKAGGADGAYGEGACLYKLGRIRDARIALDRCLRLDPFFEKASLLRKKISTALPDTNPHYRSGVFSYLAAALKRSFGTSTSQSEELGREILNAATTADTRADPRVPREIDLSNLPYTPLPPSPLSWEIRKKRDPHTEKTSPNAKKGPLFLLSEWCDWRILAQESLPMSERPDPAFKETFPTKQGCLFVDRKGRSKRSHPGKAIIQLRSRTGSLAFERTLPHDIYRLNANPHGSGLAALSSDLRL